MPLSRPSCTPRKSAIAVSQINPRIQATNLAYSVQEGPPAVLERSDALAGAAPPEGGGGGDGGVGEINESASKENAEDKEASDSGGNADKASVGPGTAAESDWLSPGNRLDSNDEAEKERVALFSERM